MKMDKKVLYDCLNFLKGMTKEEFQEYESKLEPLNIDYSKYEDSDFEILLCNNFEDTVDIWKSEFKISEYSTPKLKLKSKNMSKNGFLTATFAKAS
jgi:hypothetical protein